MPKVQVKVERDFVPHNMLLSAAVRSLEAAKARRAGCWWDWLTTILYCSLSVEAIGNTYGETLVPQWRDFESASPLAKMRLTAEHCGIKPDFSKLPWSTVPELISFRNRIAHLKPENLTVKNVYAQEEYEKYLYERPLSKLEKLVNERFAQQSYDSLYEILGLLSKKMPKGKHIRIGNDSCHGIAQPAPLDS